jgi:hypothetical protein
MNRKIHIFLFVFLIGFWKDGDAFSPSSRPLSIQKKEVSIHRRLYGEWIVWHSTNGNFLNREVVHIYPNNQLMISYRYKKGPFLYHREKHGEYRIEKKRKSYTKIYLQIHQCQETLLSIYGVGIQDMLDPMKTKNTHPYKTFKMNINMYCVGPDDLYLFSTHREMNHYHLVRSVRINEPKIDIPISTFLFTQLISIVISQVLHFFLHSLLT